MPSGVQHSLLNENLVIHGFTSYPRAVYLWHGKSTIYQMSSSSCYKVVTIVSALRPVSRTTSQPANQPGILMQCRAPVLHLANARMLNTTSKSYTSSSRNLYANLKSAFRRFILLSQFLSAWSFLGHPMAVKYALKRYDEHNVRKIV